MKIKNYKLQDKLKNKILKTKNKELIKIDFSNKFQGRFDLLLMFGGVLFIVLITYNIYCITRILK